MRPETSSLATSLRVLLTLGRSGIVPQSLLVRLVHHDLCAPVNVVRRDAQSLERALDQLTNYFTVLGSQVEQLVELNHSLIESGRNLVTAATGQDESQATLDCTVSLLAEPLIFVELCHVSIPQLGSLTDELLARIQRLLTLEKALKDAIYPLRFTQLIFRVESARLPADVIQMFGDLIAQMAELQGRVDQTVSEQFQLLAAVLPELRRLRKILSTSEQLFAAGTRRKQDVEALLERVGQELLRNSRQKVGLDELIQWVASHVNGVVMGIQSHDIVSQKLHHLVDALDQLQKAYDGLPDSEGTLSTDLVKLTRVVQVQGAQLRQCMTDLGAASESCSTAVAALLDRMMTFDSDCLLLKEFEAMIAAANGPVQVLLEATAEVRKLVGGAVSTAREANDAIRPVGAIVAKLSQSTSGLVDQMRRIALNAQIQAIRHGQGTALEMVAAQAQVIAQQTTEETDHVSADLRHALGLVTMAVEKLDELRESGESHREVLENAAVQQERELHAVRDHALDLFNQLSTNFDSVHQLLEQMSGSTQFDKPLHEPADALAQSLQALNSRLYLMQETMPAGPEQLAVDEELQSRYTMESERIVHQLATTGADPAAKPINAAPAGPAQPAEMDVEFF